MIIVDFNQVCTAAIAVEIAKGATFDHDLVEHFLLSTVRSLNRTHKAKYGELVIATDFKSWRKNEFKYYKANRKKARDKDPDQWKRVYDSIFECRRALIEHSPFKVINIEECEADDIIGRVALTWKYRGGSRGERLLIVSSDKDFKQLHGPLVSQWSPSHKGFIEVEDPKRELAHLILHGDTGDGVPNVLSQGDSLMSGRQRPIRSAVREEWLNNAEDLEMLVENYALGRALTSLKIDSSELRDNYLRNKVLVDLSQTPQDLCEDIDAALDSRPGGDMSTFKDYLISRKMAKHLEYIQDFVPNLEGGQIDTRGSLF